MITALAVFGGSVVIFACINLIVAIVTGRNPLRFKTPGEKPGRVDAAFVTILTLMFIIFASLIVYWRVTNHEIYQSGWYQGFVVGVVVQLLVNVAYYCTLIYEIRNHNSRDSHKTNDRN